jgi:hypothetical protein
MSKRQLFGAKRRDPLGVARYIRAHLIHCRGYDVVVGGLSPAQTRSVAARLSAAAIVVEADPGLGIIWVPRSRNKAFRVAHVVLVIREWLSDDERRHASLTLVDRLGDRTSARAPHYSG